MRFLEFQWCMSWNPESLTVWEINLGDKPYQNQGLRWPCLNAMLPGQSKACLPDAHQTMRHRMLQIDFHWRSECHQRLTFHVVVEPMGMNVSWDCHSKSALNLCDHITLTILDSVRFQIEMPRLTKAFSGCCHLLGLMARWWRCTHLLQRWLLCLG